MKIKKTKIDSAVADELGDQYSAAHAKVKAAQSVKNEIGESIKATTKDLPGERKLISGKRWTVGTIVVKTPIIDLDRLRLVVPKKLHSTVIRTEAVANLDEIKKLYENGTLTAAQLRKCITYKTHQRLLVTEKGSGNENQEDPSIF